MNRFSSQSAKSRSTNIGKSAVTRRRVLAGAGAAGAGLALSNSLLGAAFAQARSIKIGVLAPLSGVYASLGTNKVNGIKMFYESQGMKLAGRPVQLVVEDTEAKTDVGLRKARKLVEEDQVDVLLGVISSAIGLGLKDYVNRVKKVWVTTGAAADEIFKKKNNSPYAFRASLSVWQANHPMGTWLAQKGFKRVFVTGPDYAMGRSALTAFESTFTAKGAKKVGEFFAPLGTNDFAPYLSEIKKTAPDVVYASYAGSDAVRFVQQYAQFGLQSIKLSGYGYLVSEDLLPAQGNAALGVESGLNWAYGIDTPANREFIAKYEKQYHTTPTVDSIAGYVGAQVIAEAVKSLGGNIESQDALSQAIVKVKFDSPRGPVSFDPETHNVIQNIYIREVARTNGGLHNKVLLTYKNVRDPGT